MMSMSSTASRSGRFLIASQCVLTRFLIDFAPFAIKWNKVKQFIARANLLSFQGEREPERLASKTREKFIFFHLEMKNSAEQHEN